MFHGAILNKRGENASIIMRARSQNFVSFANFCGNILKFNETGIGNLESQSAA